MMNVLESEHLENKDGEYMPEHTGGGGKTDMNVSEDLYSWSCS